MKETKGRRRKRLFSGMNLADLKWINQNHKVGDPLPKRMKPAELYAEIERREKIAAGMVNQPRAGGRFAATAAKECAKRPEDEVEVIKLGDEGAILTVRGKLAQEIMARAKRAGVRPQDLVRGALEVGTGGVKDIHLLEERLRVLDEDEGSKLLRAQARLRTAQAEKQCRELERGNAGILAEPKEERLPMFPCTCGHKIVIPPGAPEVITCGACGAIYSKAHGKPEPLEDMLRRVIRRELELRDEKRDRALLDALEGKGSKKKPSLLRRLKRWLL